MRGVGALSGVLDPVPDTHDDSQQFKSQFFIVVDDIAFTAQFNPPVSVLVRAAGDLAKQEIVLGHLARPWRGEEVDRLIVFCRREQDRRTLRVLISFFQCERLVIEGAWFTASAKLRTRFEAQPTIPGTVAIGFGLDAVDRFSLVASSQHLLDAAVAHFCGIDRGVQFQGEQLFTLAKIVKRQIKQLEGSMRIPPSVFQADLFDQPSLAPAGALTMNIGADDVHSDLAGSIATQSRAILNQQCTGPVASSGESSADSCHATTGDQNIYLQVDDAHVLFQRGEALFAPRAAVRGRARVRVRLRIRLRIRLQERFSR